jgi:hypothetical protein
MDIVIIAYGAWYTAGQLAQHPGQDPDPEREFNRSLHLLRGLAETLIKEEKKIIVYQNIPPATVLYRAEWKDWFSRNLLAKKVLSSVGVIIADSEPATRPRKQLSPGLSQDGMHWCFSGSTDMVTFLNEGIFQLIAARLSHQEKNNIIELQLQ